MTISEPCTFLPPYLLDHLAAAAPDDAAERVRRTLAVDRALRERRAGVDPATRPAAAAVAGPDWIVHDAQNGTALPGVAVLTAGEGGSSDDPAVTEAAEGTAAALALFAEAFGRDSYDGAGATALVSVHYERDYANAFWDGTHLVFGDGDGEVFDRFTKAVDVLGHELSHGVVERTAGLVYQGQPGALNESVCDVFAACLKQRLLDESADQADWLIGEGLFLPGVRARALRDMAAPGTAYDDPRLGRDPQPGHLDDYVETTDDNGGVHINSGIPNRAFVLAARAIGGRSWEGAGPVWYAALTSADVGPQTDFASFAATTIAVAGEHADAVAGAWEQVGVTPGGAAGPVAPPVGGGRTVRVSRSGGFAGLTTARALDLDRDDDRAARARDLLGRVDLGAVGTPAPPAPPVADGFVYAFEVDGGRYEVPEQRLDGDLAALARLVLDD